MITIIIGLVTLSLFVFGVSAALAMGYVIFLIVKFGLIALILYGIWKLIESVLF